jgi:AcrR family transcriptional regulator
MPKVSQEHLDARRRQILEGARACFARNGYEGATVRLLEADTGMSRGAIFHHFRDKEALFLALAEEDFAEMAQTVARDGLVQVMRELPQRDPDWLGTWAEITRRVRTDPEFATLWRGRQEEVAKAARDRLQRGRKAGTIRTDVPLDTLLDFLLLALEGVVLHRAMGTPVSSLGGVLDLVEEAVRAR